MKITSKKLLELGEISTHNDVKLAALLSDRMGPGVAVLLLLLSFICWYKSVTYFAKNRIK